MDIVKWLRLQWDRAGAWLCIAVGGLALLFGWVGMSRTAYPAEQLPYILSGGIAGIFFLGLGAMLWLSADLRDEWNKLDRLEEKMGDRPGDAARHDQISVADQTSDEPRVEGGTAHPRWRVAARASR